MKYKIYMFLLIFFLPIKLVASELNKFEKSLTKDKRCFHSNGIPNHKTGIFPNKGKYMFAFLDIPKNQLLVQKLKE